MSFERLDTISGDFLNELLLNVSLKQITDAKNIIILGHNESIPIGTEQVMWELGGGIAQTGIFPLAPVDCYISSSSTLDIGQTIKVNAIDTDWKYIEFGVTLNGRSGIKLPVQVRRITRLTNEGSTNLNGFVYAGTEQAPALGVPTLINTMCVMDGKDNLSHCGFYTVPVDKVFLAYEFCGGSPSNDSMMINGLFSNPETQVFKNGIHVPVYRTHISQRIGYYLFKEKTDIVTTATAYSNNSFATSMIMGIELPKAYLGNL